MVDKEKIRKTLKECFKTDKHTKMTIADDGRVSVTGSVYLKGNHSYLPVQFDTVDGVFYCGYTGLQSLQGSPTKVEEDFGCSDNQLLSLEGGPDWVGSGFSCVGNPLESLKGAPSYIGGKFYFDYNPSLPLLRTLVAKGGVWFHNREYPFAVKIQDVLNQFKGQGKAGVLKCSHALLTLEKEIGIDIRANIKW